MNHKQTDPKKPPSPAVRVLILVPGQQGGIDRLFQQARLEQLHDEHSLQASLFHTHAAVLPSIFLFPFRLLIFLVLCLSGTFDLCHINLASRGSTIRKVIFALLCRLTRTPYVIHLHGAAYREFFAGLPNSLKRVVRSFFRNADKVIVLGSVWRDFVANTIGVHKDKIVVLANAVSGPDNYPDMPDKDIPPHILFIGRLGDRKGTPELITALADKRLASLSWRATLAGDGEVDLYKQKIKTLGLTNKVCLPGWVGPEEVAALLERSSLLVLPSHAENFPLSMLEGMAYGLCPVVTPVGAVKDAIHNEENGILIPAGDANALTNALVDLLENPKKRDKLAQNARRTFEKKYDIKDYGAKLLRIYKTVLERNQ